MNEQVRKRGAGYCKAKKVAREGKARARRKLAGRKDALPEILYFLAEDENSTVRRATAANPATPAQADLLLARDSEVGVRSDLAGKIATLVPGLGEQAVGRLEKITTETIGVLARDELPRVRTIMAEALAEVTGTPPPEIMKAIHKLAADDVIAVAGPVLERSALLTDADILEIIANGPPAGALSAIARRDRAGESLTDHIAEKGDVDAVAALLANKSAQIREETLDRLVERAPPNESWHEPLVRRPKLSSRSALGIAGFVAHSLLEVLRRRKDLDPETAGAVAEKVAKRLKSEAGEKSKGKQEESAGDRVQRLHKEGKLTVEMITAAVDSGKRDFAIAGLAALAELRTQAVRDLMSAHSAKAATALAWKAGLNMRQAIQVQLRLAGVSPQGTLYAKNGTDFPLSKTDMEWQLELFSGTGGKSA